MIILAMSFKLVSFFTFIPMAKYLGYVLWALRECPHETAGFPPWVMVYGKLPRGPLAVLKENWSGQRESYL